MGDEDPLPGLCPWTSLGDFHPPDPLPLVPHCKHATGALHSIGPPLDQFAGSASVRTVVLHCETTVAPEHIMAKFGDDRRRHIRY